MIRFQVDLLLRNRQRSFALQTSLTQRKLYEMRAVVYAKTKILPKSFAFFRNKSTTILLYSALACYLQEGRVVSPALCC